MPRKSRRRASFSGADTSTGAAVKLLSLPGCQVLAMAATSRQVVVAVSAGTSTACNSLHIVKTADHSVVHFSLQGEAHLLSCNVCVVLRRPAARSGATVSPSFFLVCFAAAPRSCCLCPRLHFRVHSRCCSYGKAAS